VCACLLAGCGDTIQSQSPPASALETLEVTQHYPVYWLGLSFDGLRLSAVSSDPSGAYSLQYGSCVSGGPETCVAPVELVSSPDNSFLPGAGGGAGAQIRGVKALLLQGGRVVEIATGAGVIDIHARRRRLALAAAQQMVPVNELGHPGEALPKALPDTKFAQRPMEGQQAPMYLGAPTRRSAARR
jgi:hypothetical protein